MGTTYVTSKFVEGEYKRQFRTLKENERRIGYISRNINEQSLRWHTYLQRKMINLIRTFEEDYKMADAKESRKRVKCLEN